MNVSMEQIEELKEECLQHIADGRSKFRGMTYEEGIIAVLDWLFGKTDENPLDE